MFATRTSSRRWVGTCCVLLGLCTLGCGKSRESAVEGTVTLDGKPVTEGIVRFFPLDDTDGYGAAATIQQGKYSLALTEGLYAGRYRVEVRAVVSTGKIALPNEAVDQVSHPTELRFERVPPRYHDQSMLEATLEPGQNRFDLTLERDRKWEEQLLQELPPELRQAVQQGFEQ